MGPRPRPDVAAPATVSYPDRAADGERRPISTAITPRESTLGFGCAYRLRGPVEITDGAAGSRVVSAPPPPEPRQAGIPREDLVCGPTMPSTAICSRRCQAMTASRVRGP